MSGNKVILYPHSMSGSCIRITLCICPSKCHYYILGSWIRLDIDGACVISCFGINYQQFCTNLAYLAWQHVQLHVLSGLTLFFCDIVFIRKIYVYCIWPCGLCMLYMTLLFMYILTWIDIIDRLLLHLYFGYCKVNLYQCIQNTSNQNIVIKQGYLEITAVIKYFFLILSVWDK